MYLDTDVILALIKEEDWLKELINFKKIKNPQTSTLTLIEVRLVLTREISRKDALDSLSKIKNLGVKIIPLDIKIVEESNNLMKKYDSLGIFDSIHAACTILKNEVIISTDTVYKEISELSSQDPRSL